MFQVRSVSLLIIVCFLFSQIFKGKKNNLDLIQELRTVNALQKEEQTLQKADKELTKSLAKKRDKSRHKVKYADIVAYDIVQMPNKPITLSHSALPRPLRRRHLRPEWLVQS